MIFSRLYIQECIDLIRDKNRNLKQLLMMLNSKDKQALDAMWEIVIAAELSKLGNVDLEKDYSGYGTNSKPDILFSNNNLDFLADIKCVSDHNKHDNNRVGELQLLIYQHFSSLGLRKFSCHIDVEDTFTENRNGKSIDLKLPKDISGYFHNYVKNKLKLDQLNYSFKDLGEYKGLCFSLRVSLNDQFSTAHHASYTVSEDDRNTTIYNTLSKHYKQIEFYNGFKGFIVCDGDYQLFKQKNYGGRRYSTFESVCNFYLRQKKKIGFIVGIWIENKIGIYERGIDVKCRVYCSNIIKKQDLEKIFGKVVESLPEVIRSPGNAKNLLLSENKYGTGSIGFKVQSNKTEATYSFSLREIQSILAGYKNLMVYEKHNMFLYITSGKLVSIWVDHDEYKEDYHFNLKCSEERHKKVEKIISNYDVLISIQSFLDLMVGKMDFKAFEEECFFDDKLKINPFKYYYDNGYLIKYAWLIGSNKIGFKFDTAKSPLISDFV